MRGTTVYSFRIYNKSYSALKRTSYVHPFFFFFLSRQHNAVIFFLMSKLKQTEITECSNRSLLNALDNFGSYDYRNRTVVPRETVNVFFYRDYTRKKKILVHLFDHFRGWKITIILDFSSKLPIHNPLNAGGIALS